MSNWNWRSSSPDFISVAIKGVDGTARHLKKIHRQVEKASNTAIRIEGYRLKNQLAKDLRQGAPGGRRFADLSYLRRFGRAPWKGRKNNPLYPLAKAVRYHVRDKRPYTLAIGFVGPTNVSMARAPGYSGGLGRGISEQDIVGGSWRRLALRHQQGFTRKISDNQRKYFINRGAKLGTIDGGDTPFFLKKTTKQFKTPARLIIDPFYRSQEPNIKRNIAKNFRLKMQGKRI